jgi:hypothetical protein
MFVRGPLTPEAQGLAIVGLLIRIGVPVRGSKHEPLW